jgi:hypothetical protein
MYCPNCAAPIDGAKFCRTCGANVSLVPQALSGQLPEAQNEQPEVGHRRRRHRDPASVMANGIRQTFFGSGFLLVALALMFSGADWGMWMLIPAFGMIGAGVAQMVSAKQRANMLGQAAPPAVRSAPRAGEISAPATSQIKPPASVVEDTTRRFKPAEPAEKQP